MTDFIFYFIKDHGRYEDETGHTFGETVCMLDVEEMDDTDETVCKFLNYFKEETPFYIRMDNGDEVVNATEDAYGRHLLYVPYNKTLEAFAALCQIVEKYKEYNNRLQKLYYIFKAFMEDDDIYIVLYRY